MGLPLKAFLDTTNKSLYPTGAQYKSLWDSTINLSYSVRMQIQNYFLNRETCHAYPQYWLHRWYTIILREQDKWNKLIKSESVLTDDDMKYNTDVHEETQTVGSVSNNSEGETHGTNTATDTAYSSDTPEGSISDIAQYMTTGSSASNTGTSEGTSRSSSSDVSSGNVKVHRYGNIGVQTSAQILGGYREATSFCTVEHIIIPALERLFLADFGDTDEVYGYMY